MPRRTSRQKEAYELIRAFLYFHKSRQARLLRTQRRRHQLNLDAKSDSDIDIPSHNPSEHDADSTGSTSSSSTHRSDSDGNASDLSFDLSISDEDDLLSSYTISSGFSSSGSDTSSQSGHSQTSDTSDSLSETDSESYQEFLLGFEADIEDGSDDEEPDSDFEPSNSGCAAAPKLSRFVRENVQKMYQSRYTQARKNNQRPMSDMRHILQVDKLENPADFRLFLRVSPATFDEMVAHLSKHSVFHNHSTNGQMAVEDQLAIVLYRFGHFGNAAGISKVARWSGYGKGTVLLVTKRVMTAILDKDFMQKAVRLPTEAEKEKAKQWVEEHSCKEWRDGWCMVDGTLVPLFDKPFWYGESYFDRKSNYSLNIQIVSLPNLRIIDYGYGFTGSTHDATAWEKTHIYAENANIFDGNEFIWGDSAYPIEVWVVSPYKKPDSELPENAIYNNHVSIVRIRSEHAIGFLKGRFQSLKGLRINIVDEASHKFATYWIVSCIGLHSFAIDCEARERRAAGEDSSAEEDPFIFQGLSTDSDEPIPFVAPRTTGHQTRASSLAAGKARREHLKAALLQHKQACRRRRQQNDQESSADENE